MIKEYRLPSDSTRNSLDRLQHHVDTIPMQLRSFTSEEFSGKPAPDKWSKKQILGHLIDSATNNHHRFVRGQFEKNPTILYEQDKWNAHSYYEKFSDAHLIAFWEIYNRHLIELIRNIPPHLMQSQCTMDDGSTRTLEWLFDDYVRHMENHLEQITDRENVRT